MKRALQVVGVVVLTLVAIALVRALTVASKQVEVPPAAKVAFDETAAAQRLSGAVKHATVWKGADAPEFVAFRAYLKDTWPLVHEKLLREEIGQSLLYTWKGSDPAAAPIVLMAHQDVVPVEEATLGKWTHPPYAGVIADGFVWGRGTADDKGSLCGILEAVTLLLQEGKTPKRTVYLAMGADEEVHGGGATAIVDELQKRKVAPAWVLDEASAITDGVIKGLKPKAALISIAEKGFFTLKLRVEGPGGHSSMPPPHTNAGILAAAVTRLENDPFPATFEGPVGAFFDTVAPEMPLGPRLALANRWLLGPVLKAQLSAAPSTSAALRTTTAVTMLSAGIKDNVLPVSAEATVNFRIRPGETRATVVERVKRVIADERVVVVSDDASLSSDPSSVSPIDAEGYRTIEKTIRAVFPKTIVAPNASNGASDSRFFTRITPQVYRFVPLTFRSEDLPRLHGIDERVSVEGYADAVRFYRQLLVEQ